MPPRSSISPESRAALLAEANRIGLEILDVDRRLKEATDKKNSADGHHQQVQAEKNELSRKKQAILDDLGP